MTIDASGIEADFSAQEASAIIREVTRTYSEVERVARFHRHGKNGEGEEAAESSARRAVRFGRERLNRKLEEDFASVPGVRRAADELFLAHVQGLFEVKFPSDDVVCEQTSERRAYDAEVRVSG